MRQIPLIGRTYPPRVSRTPSHLVAAALLAAVGLALCPAPTLATTSYNATLISTGPKSVTRGLWGWTNGGTEYALVCVQSALDVYDVTSPQAPVRIASVPSLGADLRIVRTKGDYAFTVSQSGPVQIIDLSDPGNIHTAATYQSATITGAHTLFIDGDYLYLSLWGVTDAGLHILDISDPLNPVEVGSWVHPNTTAPGGPLGTAGEASANWLPPPKLCGCLGAGGMLDEGFEWGLSFQPQAVAPGSYQGYGPSGMVSPIHVQGMSAAAGFPVMVHDCYVRNDIAYVSCGGGGFAVVDVSDKANPTTIALVEYEGAAGHTPWLTDDGRYLLHCDETVGAPLRVWDVSDPANIHQVGEFGIESDRIVHNVYVEGELAFLAYYTEGMRVLDISDPTEPIEVAFYDHHVGPEGGYYEGAFACYPFSVSGSVFVTDIKQGLLLFDVDRDVRGGIFMGSVSGEAEPTGLEEARIRFLEMGKSVATDAQGRFRAGLPEGTHTVVIEKYGYYPDTSEVAIARDVETRYYPTLLPRPTGPLQLVVRAAWNGERLDRVAVSIPELPGGVRYTDDEGEVDWGYVPAGVYYPTFGRWGCQTQLDTVEVISQGPSDPFARIYDLNYGLNDSAQVDQGWFLEAEGTDATDGRWVRADPSPSWSVFPGPTSPNWDANVTPFGYAYHTGYQLPDQPQNVYDVDGGTVVMLSPRFDLTVMPHAILEYYRWFSNDTGPNPGEDAFRAEVSFDDGLSWQTLEETYTSQRSWKVKTYSLWELDDPTDAMRLRFTTEDLGGDSIVEAAVDRLSFHFETVDAPGPTTAGRLLLAPPAPNPAARGRALVRFQLPKTANCELDVIDVRGRMVRELVKGSLPAGYHAYRLESIGGAELAPGTYWLRLQSDGEVRSQKLVIVGG